ncbi:MAG: hypothetical protein ACRC4L_00180, partial [Mycoplasma sp.]
MKNNENEVFLTEEIKKKEQRTNKWIKLSPLLFVLFSTVGIATGVGFSFMQDNKKIVQVVTPTITLKKDYPRDQFN